MSMAVRSFSGFLVAFVLVLLVIGSMPRFPVEPCGIVLPVYGAKPYVVGGMKLYEQAAMPLTAEPIGSVSMMYHTALPEAAAQRVFFKAVSQLAAKAGGNGVVLNQFFFIPSSTASGPALYFRGSVVLTH